MPRLSRPRIDPTDDWEQLQLRIQWPEQLTYELIRPVVLFGHTAGERAQQTGAAERTVRRRAHQFDRFGLASLFGDVARSRSDDGRLLSPDLRQTLIDLKTECPALRPNELATICYVRCGRRPSARTIQPVLATGPPPTRLDRRYPLFAEMADAAERRLAIVRLHAEGWTVTRIADYLQTTRRTVYLTLQRWVEEGVRGLEDKSSAPKHAARKVNLRTIETVRKLQENPLLGEFRIHAALKQLGIHLSQRTCGRILALNRSLYSMPGPTAEPHEPKPMPFAASRRHQYWTVDVRYLDMHQLGGGMIYCISILENYSRCMLASLLSRSQDLTAYLMVLYAAIRRYGSPEALVSDGGGIFKAKQAMAIYQALGIRKEQIDKRQAWQSYIESNFTVQRRMADWHFARATSWEELLAVHDRWLEDFNTQDHWAHREREDERHSPAACSQLPGEIPLRVSLVPWQRTLPDQPAFRSGDVAVRSVHPDPARLTLDGAGRLLQHRDRLPLVLWHCLGQFLGGVQGRNLERVGMFPRPTAATIRPLRHGPILPFAPRSSARRNRLGRCCHHQAGT